MQTFTTSRILGPFAGLRKRYLPCPFQRVVRYRQAPPPKPSGTKPLTCRIHPPTKGDPGLGQYFMRALALYSAACCLRDK